MSARSTFPFLNIFGFLAYLSCLFQWALVILPFLPGILDSDVFHTFVPSGESEAKPDIPSPEVLPDWLIFIIIAIIAVGVIIVTVLAFGRLPRAVGQTGQKLTRSAAEYAIPIVTHHAKIPEKKRRALTARIVFDIKLAVLTLPLIVLLIVPLPETTVAPQVLVLVAALAAGWSLFLFCLQAMLARVFKVSLDRLW